MRVSLPMPHATSITFAPTASRMLATPLMNEIWVTQKATETCLIFYPVCRSVIRMCSFEGSTTMLTS